MSKNAKPENAAATDLFTAGLKSMEGLGPMQAVALKAWSDVGVAALKFTSLRMQHDVEAQKAMLACKSLGDVQKVQTEFFSKALADYKAEAARLMKIMSAPIAQVQTDAAISTKRAYDDVPL